MCLCATPHLSAASSQTLPLRATRPEELVLGPGRAAHSRLTGLFGDLSLAWICDLSPLSCFFTWLVCLTLFLLFLGHCVPVQELAENAGYFAYPGLDL